MTLHWTKTAQDGAARRVVLHTAHGTVETPVFMPVGTAGTVKAMTADAVRATGARMVLGNTYHLMLRPGPERNRRLDAIIGNIQKASQVGVKVITHHWTVIPIRRNARTTTSAHTPRSGGTSPPG